MCFRRGAAGLDAVAVVELNLYIVVLDNGHQSGVSRGSEGHINTLVHSHVISQTPRLRLVFMELHEPVHTFTTPIAASVWRCGTVTAVQHKHIVVYGKLYYTVGV